MNRFGVDEDWQRLTPAQLLAAGRTFAIGYVSEDNTGKNVTKSEVQAYLTAGAAVLLVYEYSTTAISGGTAKGIRDAGIAVVGARAVGYPKGCAIAFAVDEDTSGNPAAIDGYCRAFTATVRSAGYRSMVYGGYATVKRCADLGLTDLQWQTYAWSGRPTVWDPRAVIRQVQNDVTIAGKAVDLDTAMVDDFGAWMPATPTLRGERMLVMAHEKNSNIDWIGDGVFRYASPDAAHTANVKVVMGLMGLNPTSVEFNPGTLDALGPVVVDYANTSVPLTATLSAIKTAAEAAAAAVTQPVAVTQDQINTAFLQSLSNPTVLQAIGAAVASHIHVT